MGLVGIIRVRLVCPLREVRSTAPGESVLSLHLEPTKFQENSRNNSRNVFFLFLFWGKSDRARQFFPKWWIYFGGCAGSLEI